MPIQIFHGVAVKSEPLLHSRSVGINDLLLQAESLHDSLRHLLLFAQIELQVIGIVNEADLQQRRPGALPAGRADDCIAVGLHAPIGKAQCRDVLADVRLDLAAGQCIDLHTLGLAVSGVFLEGVEVYLQHEIVLLKLGKTAQGAALVVRVGVAALVVDIHFRVIVAHLFRHSVDHFAGQVGLFIGLSVQSADGAGITRTMSGDQ